MPEDAGTPAEVTQPDDLEFDLEPHDTNWFASVMLDSMNALPEADENLRHEIRGRLWVCQDMFGLSDDELLNLAPDYVEDEVAELMEDRRP